MKIRLVLDNLSTHTPAVLYEAFPPAEAKRLLDRLEFRYTPKHGSCFNMAETEFSVRSRQCTGGRIPDATTLRSKIAAWQATRNSQACYHPMAVSRGRRSNQAEPTLPIVSFGMKD